MSWPILRVPYHKRYQRNHYKITQVSICLPVCLYILPGANLFIVLLLLLLILLFSPKLLKEKDETWHIVI